jgi:hypothetical protein
MLVSYKNIANVLYTDPFKRAAKLLAVLACVYEQAILTASVKDRIAL